MRSTMEATLRDHYHSSGENLCQLINNARNLPPDANVAALDRLRKLANAIVHLDADAYKPIKGWDETRFESEIVSLMEVLRALIEGAK